MGSSSHVSLWRSTSILDVTHVHARIAILHSISIPDILGSLLIYSSLHGISLSIGHTVVGTLALRVRSYHMEPMNLTSVGYTLESYSTAIHGHTEQDIQLSYILVLIGITSSIAVSIIWNEVLSSLAVAVRIASYGLSTFHSITKTSLAAHGSTSSYNDCTYSTLNTVVGALSTPVCTNN